MKEDKSIGKNWSSKSIGTKFQHNFFYIMIKMGGRRLAYLILYFVVFFYATFVSSVKAKTDPYLSRRFPEASDIKHFFHRYMLILQFGKTLIDRAIVGILGPESIKASFQSEEDVTRLKQLPGGFVLMLSHVGSWQVAMSALALFEKPINLLMQFNTEDVDKHYYEHRDGEKKPFNTINPEGFLGGVIEMVNVLKNDEVLGIMGDRVFADAPSSLDVNFLNEKTAFPYSAYKIASLSKKPIVVLYSFKTGSSSYQLKIAEIIEIPGKLGRTKENFKPYLEIFVKSLESFTEEYPYQFFNFYDMWNTSIDTNENHSEQSVEKLNEA
jgi:predicted LPLAT superfamily acyltransferase